MLPHLPRPHDLREFAVSVVRRLAEQGHRALFAGGCVRDQLLGLPPKDYDVATSATPAQVQELFPRTVAVGLAFGVVKVLGPRRAASWHGRLVPTPRDPAREDNVVPQDEGHGRDARATERGGVCQPPPWEVEVATFRTEEGYSDGRRPDEVTFCYEEEDVRRRDFTINGLFYDPLKDEVVDYVGGRADLARKLVRCIGEPRERFAEDYLRMLRAVRFTAQFHFELDGPTLGAVRLLSEKIKRISAERVRDELVKMLTGPDPRRAFALLKSAHLLQHVLPEVDALAGVAQGREYHPEGDVWEHTLAMLGLLDAPAATLALGALLHDIGKPATRSEEKGRIGFPAHDAVGAKLAEQILQRLRFPNTVVEQVTELVRRHMAFKDVQHMRRATLKRFLRLPHFEEHLALHRLDCLASHGGLEHYEFCQRQLRELPAEQLRPPPLLTGDDLLALGLAPGPLLGRILREVEERQLDGSLTTHEAALEFVRDTYGKGNP